MTLLIEFGGLALSVLTILLRLHSATVRLETRLTAIEATIKNNHDLSSMQIQGLNNDVADHELRLRAVERHVFQTVIVPPGTQVQTAQSSQEGH